MNMATFNFIMNKSGKTSKGYPIKLVVRKNDNRKVIALGLYTESHQWDESTQRYKNGRERNLHPDRAENNEFLSRKEVEISNIIEEFDKGKIDWTLNQFEDKFLHKHKISNVTDFTNKHINELKRTGHVGNALCYQRMLEMLQLFDYKFDKKIFSEIDFKFVNEFNVFLQCPRNTKYSGNRFVRRKGCCGNTRKYYHKALRAIYNKAIQANEADARFYPYGKGKFEISKLEEITAKRYLSDDDIEKIKKTQCCSIYTETARKLFLFSYYCHGISYIDMAQINKDNIVEMDDTKYIAYKRQKIVHQKSAHIMTIKITDEIKDILEWFSKKTLLIGNYLTPCITKDYEGEQLYYHIRNRYERYNKSLKKVARELDIKMNLTTYVARHSVAMRLRNHDISIDKIAQVLGHSNVKTTEVYLDTFNNKIIDKVISVL